MFSALLPESFSYSSANAIQLHKLTAFPDNINSLAEKEMMKFVIQTAKKTMGDRRKRWLNFVCQHLLFSPLGQYSYRGLMVVIAIRSHCCPLFLQRLCGKAAWKEYCGEHWLNEIQESIDTCTGRREITEILLKRALNTIQSINQLILFSPHYFQKDRFKNRNLRPF